MCMICTDNCNLAVDYAKDPLNFRITGIGGSNIVEGNKTLTLGLVWQVMRAYTLSILQKLAKSSKPIADKDIVNWANEKVPFEFWSYFNSHCSL